MQDSESIPPTNFKSPGAQLADALSKAQVMFTVPKKTKHVDFTYNGVQTKYSYADLADVIECCKEGLSKNGLAIVNEMDYRNGIFTLKTSLVHSSGEFVDSFYPIPNPVGLKPQVFGSALTYARRYSLSALLNIASEDDDDGQQAPPPTQKPPTPPQAKPATQAQPKPPQGPPKNYAPTSQPNPIPKAVMDEEGDLNDVFPDEAPSSLLDQLYQFVEDHQIAPDEVKDVIKRTTGKVKSSTQMSDNETLAVLKFLKVKYEKK